MNAVQIVVIQAWLQATDRPRRRGRDNGDVPGWVMITILSAVLVVGLIAIAGPKLNGLFNSATDNVTNAKPNP